MVDANRLRAFRTRSSWWPRLTGRFARALNAIVLPALVAVPPGAVGLPSGRFSLPVVPFLRGLESPANQPSQPEGAGNNCKYGVSAHRGTDSYEKPGHEAAPGPVHSEISGGENGDTFWTPEPSVELSPDDQKFVDHIPGEIPVSDDGDDYTVMLGDASSPGTLGRRTPTPEVTEPDDPQPAPHHAAPDPVDLAETRAILEAESHSFTEEYLADQGCSERPAD